MTLAVVALTILCLGQQVAHYMTQRANAAQTQKLLDRIQSPEAASIAAIEAVSPRREFEPTHEWQPLPIDGDLSFLTDPVET